MIVCRSLSFSFGTTAALHGLDFDLPRGSLAVLLGPNGSGKSTALRLLSGLLKPPGGAVTIDGIDVASSNPELKRRLGVVPDRLALLDHLSVEEHAEALGPIYGLTIAEAGRRSDQLVRLLALDRFRYTPMESCSHGTRKKAALLLTLLHAPKVLLLDEPFEGLDPTSAGAVSELLLRYSEAGATILFTSHALTVAERIATHVLLIDKGRLVWNAAASDLPIPLEDFYHERVEHPDAPEMPWLVPGH